MRIDGAAGAGEVPRAVVVETAVLFFPKRVIGQCADEGREGAGEDGDFGAAHDFQETQRMANLCVAPVVAGGHADTEHLDLGRVEEHRDGLEVGGGGAERVLVDDDFAGGHER